MTPGRVHAVNLVALGDQFAADYPQRPTGWIVGRRGSNIFVSMPEVGVEAIDLLREGRSVASTARVLSMRHGTDVDVATFVRTLCDLGFVDRIGDRVEPDPGLPRPTLAGLRQRHVWWVHAAAVPRSAMMTSAGVVLVGVMWRQEPP